MTCILWYFIKASFEQHVLHLSKPSLNLIENFGEGLAGLGRLIRQFEGSISTTNGLIYIGMVPQNMQESTYFIMAECLGEDLNASAED